MATNVEILNNQKYCLKKHFSGIEKPLPRWEICSGIVRKFMGLATNNYLEKENPISDEAISIVNNTFNFIVSVIKNRLDKFENTALLYRHLKLKVGI